MISNGRRTSVGGHKIVIYGQTRAKSIWAAWKQRILPKLQEIANLKYEWDVAGEEFKSLSALLPSPLRAEQAYTAPLGHC